MPRSYLALRRKKGLIIRRTEVRSHSKTLKDLVDSVCNGKDEDIHLVPVTVLIGRAPDKETGNEDCAALLPCGNDACVLVVADGMGGERSGGRASALAVECMRDAVEHLAEELFAIERRRAALQQAGKIDQVHPGLVEAGAHFAGIAIEMVQRSDHLHQALRVVHRPLQLGSRKMRSGH